MRVGGLVLSVCSVSHTHNTILDRMKKTKTILFSTITEKLRGDDWEISRNAFALGSSYEFVGKQADGCWLLLQIKLICAQRLWETERWQQLVRRRKKQNNKINDFNTEMMDGNGEQKCGDKYRLTVCLLGDKKKTRWVRSAQSNVRIAIEQCLIIFLFFFSIHFSLPCTWCSSIFIRSAWCSIIKVRFVCRMFSSEW